MANEDGSAGLVELRPAPAVLLRHRDADLDVVTAPRTGPRVELRRGALWIRAGEDGPGVTVTHGASSVQVRAGAGVVEVLDMEALLVVASGRAAVKGVSPLPRSVIAGQAVTLTLDGTFTDPDALSAAELAADRMVVENLALDSLASGRPTPGPEAVADPPLPTRVPGATTAARVDPPGAPLTPGGGRGRPEPEAAAPAPATAPEPEVAEAAPAPPAAVAPTTPPVPGPPAPPPAAAPVPAAPAAEPVDPEPPQAPQPPQATEPPQAPVGRPAPSLPPAAEPSFLETALANVGVTDAPRDPVEDLAPDARTPSPAASPSPAAPTPKAAPVDPESAEARRKARILIALILGALLILALVAAVAFS